MFTGIIKSIGVVDSINSNKIRIKSDFDSGLVMGESISCSGVCLTVSEFSGNFFSVDVSPETLARTNISCFKIGDRINLEKSLKVGDELGGHLVFGHIDGVSKLVSIDNLDDTKIISLDVPLEVSKFLISKCSITLDGVSLTVNEVKRKIISISIIPYTWENTSFANLRIGNYLNTEVDMLARYTFKALENLKK
ncbi:MAG: riboflavin synthase [Rickettsiales bacterium]|nr:riboflavin synthase [Rickettsiales bacterium]|tara:strand:- start:682 stop:1263 length:582 start_codon:yes stop_codon:yes gene_type:complete